MSGRIRFANQLRGIAALSVAASHLVGVFWIMPDVVTSATFTPAQTGAPPAALAIVAYPWFNLGPFGVAVFFLISGFVIPFSLEKYSRLGFACARLLRIYPTYIVALLLEMAVLYAASLISGRPFTISGWTIFTNAMLFYDVLRIPSLDLVNWTLSVEIKFYVLVILLLPAIRRGRASMLVAAAAAIVGVNAFMATGVLGDLAAASSTIGYTVSSHSVCLTYMLIGVAFNLHLRRLLSTGGLLLVGGVLFALFLETWRLSVWAVQFPVVTINYGLALLLFAGLYAVRRWVPPNPVLDAMAAISFPFYVIHSLMGYVLLRALMVGLHFSYGLAIAVTLPVLLLGATGLHVLVERPTIGWGHFVAQRLTLRKPSFHITALS